MVGWPAVIYFEWYQAYIKAWSISTVFSLQASCPKKTVRDAFHSTAEDVLGVWAKASIPTRLKKHVVSKVEDMFREWEKLKKNKENKVKRSEILQQKEENWKEGLEDLFDIAHASALELMTIQEDKDFLMHGSYGQGKSGKVRENPDGQGKSGNSKVPWCKS